MREIIRKFSMGHPKQVIGPALWYFFEGLTISFPAVCIYFAINIIVLGFDRPMKIDFKGLWLITSIMGALFIIQLLVSTGTFLGTYLPGSKHSAEDKIDFIRKLKTLHLGYFSKKETGEIINTFTGDFLAIEQAMVGAFTGLFGVVISCILIFVFIFIFNPKMAVAFSISMPIAALIIKLSLNMLDKLSVTNREAKDKTAEYLKEYLLGMKTLRTYNLIGSGFSKLKDAYKYLMKQSIRSEIIGGTLLNLAYTFVSLGLPLMCLMGAYMILGGELSIVEYLSLIIIGTKILSPLLTWVRYMATLRNQYVSATRIDNVMQQKALKGEKELTEVGDLEFHRVSFSYNEKDSEKVLDGISFNIPNKKLTAIIGPSGGGKSTILKLIARFWDIQRGSITCKGTNLKDVDPEKWLKNISMVLQDVYLFHDTIRENILFGRKDVTEKEMIDASKRAGCHEFIMNLPEGYDTLVGEGGSTLSGGEKQRISIARAIIKDAPILLLDEPTASLDARNETLVQRAIVDLVKGRTVVMIAHRLKTVQNADQILVLDRGKIVEAGIHIDLLNNKSLYERLWSLQNKSKEWNISKL